ncbi:antenna complex, alpha/beta subunit [Chondromyces apiculatus DSM 436]|uniref:Antenna complex, alpha/beta subunit n=2 Tax=Chondromyces apiculatus TaxID=51 RepID=A0A017T9I9_9BACT|nr:antenna complex, alpha/beta subunit [Chondromyces apiculatus DSM 436]
MSRQSSDGEVSTPVETGVEDIEARTDDGPGAPAGAGDEVAVARGDVAAPGSEAGSDAAGAGDDAAAVEESAGAADESGTSDEGSAASAEEGAGAAEEGAGAAEEGAGAAEEGAGAAPTEEAAAPTEEAAAPTEEAAAPTEVASGGDGTMTEGGGWGAEEDAALREGLNRPPLLASEALMEDLAPMEPARDAARLWCAAIGLVFIALGALLIAGLRQGGGASGFIGVMLGGLTLVLALTRITYRQRAAAMLGIGVMATVLGLVGSGPAMGIEAGGKGWGVARAVAAAALPAALAFRGRYRAYAGARWLLGAAFATALPFTLFVILRLTTQDIGLGEASAMIVVLAMTAGLLGFMGAETTSAGAYLALAVNLALAGDLAFDGLAALDPVDAITVAPVLAAAVAFAATSALTSIGLFQILAWRLAPAARRINLHPPPKPAGKSHPSGSDWLT